MPAVASWANLMPWSVSIAPRTSGDSYSGQTYGTAVSHNARIEPNPGDRVIKDSLGQEIVFAYKVFLQTTTAPNALAKVTLPSAAPFNSGTPEIVHVEPQSDENGIHHVVLWVK